MAVLTAAKIGEENVTIFSGSQTELPAQSTFIPDAGNFLAFSTGENEDYGQFVCSNEYNDPDFSLKSYAITNSGYVQYSGTVNIGSIPMDSGVSTVGTVYFGGAFWAAMSDNAGNLYFFQSDIVGLADGVVFGALTYFSDAIAPVYADGANDYRIKIVGDLLGNVYGYQDNSANVEMYCICVPDGVGGITQMQMWEVSQTLTSNFDKISTLKSARYRSIYFDASDFNAVSLIDWLPSSTAGAADAIFYDLAFDVMFLNYCITQVISYDGYFYCVQSLDPDTGLNIIPRILKVDYDWTEYEEIILAAGDANVDAIFSAWIAGAIPPITFMLDPVSGAILLTAGMEPPQYYGTSISSAIINDRTTKQPFPLGLPCIVPCIPVIDRRLKK